jgi:Tol biopolymer transport system component
VTLLLDGGDGHIHTVRSDGTKLRRIATGRFATWSADGRTIAFSESDGDIAAVNPRGKNHRVLVHGDGPRLYRLYDFSPDGRRLLYAGRAVRTLNLRTGKRTAFRAWAKDRKKINPIDLAWTPGGRRIAYLHWGKDSSGRPRDEIRTVRPDGTQVRTVLELPLDSDGRAGISEFAWQSR